MKKYKRAFALAELLVVVIVLGVLAAVAVPKYTRVLETRKTTEAEEMFAAVRAEQEHRCVTGKSYLGKEQQERVTALALAGRSKNYMYELTASGIQASGGGYRLKMLSYKDGNVCCEDIETGACTKLNKNYPDCAALRVPADECTQGQAEPKPQTPPEENSCASNPGTANCCSSSEIAAGKTWNASAGKCICAGGPECGGRCVSACWGGKTLQSDCTCACPAGKEEVNGYCLAPCQEGETRSGAYPYDCLAQSACDLSAKPADIQTSCGPCGKQTISYTCNQSTGAWVSSPGACVVPAGYSNECVPGATSSRSCISSSSAGTQSGTCSSVCAWEWSGCQTEKTNCPLGKFYREDMKKCCSVTGYKSNAQPSQEVTVPCPSQWNKGSRFSAQPGPADCPSGAVTGTSEADCPQCTMSRTDVFIFGSSQVSPSAVTCTNGKCSYASGSSGVNATPSACKIYYTVRQNCSEIWGNCSEPF